MAEHSFNVQISSPAFHGASVKRQPIVVRAAASGVKATPNGFSLIEVAVVLALVSLLIGLALPRYSAQQHQGYATAMQLELLACVQTLHSLELTANPSDENPWLTLADGDGDGVGDQANGSLAAAICPISPSTKGLYDIQVDGSELGFQLRALPQADDAGGVWVVDHLGRQNWLIEPSDGSGV